MPHRNGEGDPQTPIPLAHATSIHHDDVPPPKIIQGEDLA
jgi:hypothetical protein